MTKSCWSFFLCGAGGGHSRGRRGNELLEGQPQEEGKDKEFPG